MKQINPSIKSRLHTEKWQMKPLSYYVEGIIDKRDQYILSEAITLLESSLPEHRQRSLEILQACYHHRVKSFRFGITGSPGVGKSTFIDSIATFLHASDELFCQPYIDSFKCHLFNNLDNIRKSM